MPKPFANSPQFNGDIIESYILGIQIGTNKDDSGLPQMMYVKASKLRAFMREGMASVYNYRGEFSTLPTDLAVGDTFYASSSFSEGGNTYLAGHLYAYNGTSWDDITNIFAQYAKQAQVDNIDERLTEAESKIDALSGFIFKGDATRATLPTASASNQGWVYYLTDESIYVASDGTQWVTVMNYVVQTITEGDTTHAPSADAVYKALAQRDAKDADLQSQIVNTNAELDNVEALIGGDAQVENIDPTEGESLLAQSRLIHHTNLLPNGDFGRVGARATQFNQLVADNKIHQTITGQNGTYVRSEFGNFNLINGHKYLVAMIGTAPKVNGLIMTNDYSKRSEPATAESVVIINLTSPSGYYSIWTMETNGTAYSFDLMLCDLTAMNLASLSASQFRSLFPASYYPHDTGHIYNLNPTGFRIRGVNLWDEEWELGGYDNTGEKTSSTTTIRNKNMIPVNPSTAYYFYEGFSPAYHNVYYYDVNGTYISRDTSDVTAFTTPSNCYFVNFALAAGYGTSYRNDIQIALGSLSTALKTTYHASEHQAVLTPQISDGHYVNENCYDYVENVVEDGVLKGKKHSVVGAVDLGTLDWRYEGGLFRNTSLSSLMKLPSSGTVKGNMLCKLYTTITSSEINSASVMSIAINTNGLMYVADGNYTSVSSFVAGISGITLYYELATEEVTDVEPLRSFGISDYATVEPITPQDELVNRIDVPFSVKTVSANTLIEQIKTNTEDITVLKNALEDSEQRIENLEQAVSGSLVQTNTDATQKNTKTITNANTILPWALLNRVGARAVAWNQLANVGATVFGTKVNSFTFNANFSARNQTYQQTTDTIKTVSGHKYLLRIKSDGSPNLRTAVNGIIPFIGELTISQGYETILTGDGSDSYFNFTQSNVSLGGNGNIYINFFDLTAIGVYDSTKTDAENIANFKAKYPALFYPYNARGIIPLNPSGFEVVQKNKWDEEWQTGLYNVNTGAYTSDNSRICTKNYIPASPNTTYYINKGEAWALFFDANKNFISAENQTSSTRSFTTPSNCAYLMYDFASTYGNTYNHDILICLNSVTDKTYEAYSETTIDTSFTSDYKYVNPSCHDYSENVLVDGQKMREEHIVCGEISSTDTSIWSGWTYEPTSQTFRLEYSDVKCGNNNISIVGYTVKSYSASSSDMGDMQVKLHDTNFVHRIYVKNTNYNQSTIEQFKASLGKIYYQKDAEIVNTISDPIPNFPCEDGTTITAITPQTDLVNAIDVPTTIAYMTKIGG